MKVAPSEQADREPRVGGIKFEGNSVLRGSQLQEVTFTRGPSWKVWQADPVFAEATLIGDLKRIEALYQVHGHYQATTRYSLVWNRTATTVAITVHVEEGPAIEVVALRVDLPATPVVIADDLPLGVGGIFSASRYAASKQIILDRFAEAGYPLASIQGGATVEVPKQMATIHWIVDPGPPVYFGEITVEGLYLVREKTVRREVTVRPGQRYSTRSLIRTRRRMQQQGLYAWVTVQAQPRSEDSNRVTRVIFPDPGTQLDGGGDDDTKPPDAVTWPVSIRVTERPPYTVDAGIGYSSDESFRASAGWRHGNFLGDARNLRLTGLYSGILGLGQIEFTQPYFFDPRLSLIVKGSVRNENEPAYEANRFVASVGLARPIRLPWVGRVTYEYSLQDVVRKTLLPLDEPEGRSAVSRLELGLRRNTTDDLLNPTRGTWLDILVAPSLKALGSDFDFITYLLEMRGFYSVGSGHILAGRFRIGAIQPLRGTNAATVPVTDRFFSGGSVSHRGFPYHELPPNGNFLFSRLGGNSSLEATVEYRFPIWKKIGGVIFVDAALLDVRPFHYPMDNLFWAIGPGIRYDTLVGPLRFDFGTLLNPSGTRTGRYQWYISVGHTF